MIWVSFFLGMSVGGGVGIIIFGLMEASRDE